MNENETWYVKAAIRRGMQSVENSIEEAESTIAKLPEDSPMRGTVVDMLTNMTSYNKQLLHEMKQYIPAELQPEEH